MLFIRAKYKVEKDMEEELCFIKKIEYMKVSGSMMLEMEKDMKDTLMLINMKENLLMEKLMEKVSTNGLMEKYMMENGGVE
jgi:hypothetical protein